MKRQPSVGTHNTGTEDILLDSDIRFKIEMEFGRLRDEQTNVASQILYWLGSDERGFESNLVAISALALIVAFTLANSSYFLFLLASIPFHILVWSQVRRGILAIHLHDYVIEQLAPRIDRLVAVSGAEWNDKLLREPFKPWQETIAPLYNTFPKKILMVLPHLGRYLLQISIAVGLVYAHAELANNDSEYSISRIDQILTLVNYVLIAITLAVGLYSVLVIRVQERPSKERTDQQIGS